MRTEDCDLACSAAIALSRKTISRLHQLCPGGFRDPEGWAHRCDCECHAGEDLSFTADSALPVRTMPVSAPAPAPTRQNRAPAPTGTGRRCLCGCGEEVSATARFRPGHDAKLKSRLIRAARTGCRCLYSGDSHIAGCSYVAALTELKKLGWSHFI